MAGNSKKWLKHEIELLIKLVKQNECIWNEDHRDHSKKKVVAEIWNKISTTLSVRKEQAQNKWRTLHTAYWKEIENLPEAEADEEITSGWPYFNAMKFLSGEGSSAGKLETSGNCNPSDEEKEPPNKKPRKSVEEPQEAEKIVEEKKMESPSSPINPAIQSEWRHLISLLPYIESIPHNDVMLFRLEAFWLLFKFSNGLFMRHENSMPSTSTMKTCAGSMAASTSTVSALRAENTAAITSTMSSARAENMAASTSAMTTPYAANMAASTSTSSQEGNSVAMSIEKKGPLIIKEEKFENVTSSDPPKMDKNVDEASTSMVNVKTEDITTAATNNDKQEDDVSNIKTENVDFIFISDDSDDDLEIIEQEPIGNCKKEPSDELQGFLSNPFFKKKREQ